MHLRICFRQNKFLALLPGNIFNCLFILILESKIISYFSHLLFVFVHVRLRCSYISIWRTPPKYLIASNLFKSVMEITILTNDRKHQFQQIWYKIPTEVSGVFIPMHMSRWFQIRLSISFKPTIHDSPMFNIIMKCYHLLSPRQISVRYLLRHCYRHKWHFKGQKCKWSNSY